ncbi:aldehyde dehydrogenase [Gammaproteobacteria bacterium 45_16_T64]|nr:aldehyde dehydrogenase [Gammaproteobacteria bacterium 45_16_T64]
MLAKQYPYYLANKAVYANEDLVVLDKYSNEVATRVAMADASVIDQAIAASVRAAKPMAKMAAFERQAVLDHCVLRFRERFDELAEALCIEAGKPIKDAQGEVTRLIDTFRIAAEECTRIGGEVIPMDISARAKGYSGMTKRVPIGPCSFISPFNFPLNLAAHKVAPAIAAGCPFVLKPASLTPIGAIIIGEVLAETNLPEGAFSVLPCRREGAGLFTEDDRLKLLSFTGSPDVGWALKAKAGKKPVVLELGGNAACVVDQDADIDDAVTRIVFGAFYQSGQSCIGVQRIYIHDNVYAEFKEKLVTATKALKMGDPKDPETFIGPMISEQEATRLDRWVSEAVDAGATLLCGGERNGSMMQATLLEGVAKHQNVREEEAFGPVALLDNFSDFDDVLRDINDSKFGLQAGIFTRDLYKAQKAWNTLEVGGVVIGDVPSWRVDHMPYGGVKDSGLGREGIKYAIEDMTEIRLMVIRTTESDQ